ncbi:DUF6165 family protein [Spiribacter vilamensis]|uniref:Uncharacterized protein n=1 Tax=Spiribacter vilamensis TaxID=531306 RepID=A0A4Q8CZ35_9GAMM|nr:DUF6165 family protein [Spiribacter vilamensis]RZU98187.1 hypothetical protein EV698_0428 [Spiribacter vilamensis]TVO60912.1 hypothetical protein FPL09_01785 [Spiribacter vilamensis]
MEDSIAVPLSFGEVLDKITILEIKSERITDPGKLKNVRFELEALNRIWHDEVRMTPEITELRTQLKTVNEALWEIEDGIRDLEARQSFQEDFVRLARSVYFTNDRRAAIKKAVNEGLGSRLIEEKSYRDYTTPD